MYWKFNDIIFVRCEITLCLGPCLMSNVVNVNVVNPSNLGERPALQPLACNLNL